MFTLKPLSEAKPAVFPFAERVITAKGEARVVLPVRKGGVPLRLEARETPRVRRRTDAEREASRLFKQKRISEGFCRVCLVTVPEEGFKACAPCRAKVTAYKARITEARSLEDICIQCGTNEAPSGRACDECRAVDRVKAREYRLGLKAAGLCTQCRTLVTDGSYTRCVNCREKRMADKKALLAARRAQGICYRCGVNQAPAGQGCADCRRVQVEDNHAHGRHARRKEDLEAEKILRRERIAAGYCSNCSLRRPDADHATCEPCRRRRSARETQVAKSRRASNLCYRCGEVETPGGVYCDGCRQSEAIKRKARRLERLAAGLCCRCGERELVPGNTYCVECQAEQSQRWRKWRKREGGASRPTA